MNQMDLFAAEPAAPAYRPDPEKVRSRLRRTLAEARAAEAMPWDAARLSLYRIIVPDMTRYLPDDEAVGWRADFTAELERFGVAEPA
jgi:hypothetical protein